jgi:hypothetical protein
MRAGSLRVDHQGKSSRWISLELSYSLQNILLDHVPIISVAAIHIESVDVFRN